MPQFIMPNGFAVDIPEQLLLQAHAARDPGNNRPLLLGPGVENYNYRPPNPVRQGYGVVILDMAAIETDFGARMAVYDAPRLRSILSALYGGTDLEPVLVSRTFRAPPFKLENGFHRFIGSAVMGFTKIPCLAPNPPVVANAGAKYIPPHLRNKN